MCKVLSTYYYACQDTAAIQQAMVPAISVKERAIGALKRPKGKRTKVKSKSSIKCLCT